MENENIAEWSARKKAASLSNYHSLHTICHDFVRLKSYTSDRPIQLRRSSSKKARVYSTHNCAIRKGKTSNAVSLCDVNLIWLIEK